MNFINILIIMRRKQWLKQGILIRILWKLHNQKGIFQESYMRCYLLLVCSSNSNLWGQSIIRHKWLFYLLYRKLIWITMFIYHLRQFYNHQYMYWFMGKFWYMRWKGFIWLNNHWKQNKQRLRQRIRLK